MDYIEATQVLESTQNICINTKISNQVVGHLLIKGVNHSLFYGENTIGRDLNCSIVIPDKPVSARHAVLEVENEALHCIYDLESSNKTKLRKAFIKPNVRYVLNDGDELVFGNVPATYVKIIPEELDIDVDRTEVLTVPETPEKEVITDVAEIPKTCIYDSDDSNADLFDESPSKMGRKLCFKMPSFEVKEDNIICGVSTQSINNDQNANLKDVSIYEMDTQSFVENNLKDNEKNCPIYDLETEAFVEKLKDDNIKKKAIQEVNEGPSNLPQTASGSFEDLFDEHKFSEDIFPASQGIEGMKEVSNVPSPQDRTNVSEEEEFFISHSPQINPVLNIFDKYERVESENNIAIVEENKLELDSNSLKFEPKKDEKIASCQIEKEQKNTCPDVLPVYEEKLDESSNQQEGLTCEDKINFVEHKNFWEINSEAVLIAEDHEQLKNNQEKSENEIPAILEGVRSRNQTNLFINDALFKKFCPDKLCKNLDESSNRKDVEVKNKYEEHEKDICAIQHSANKLGLSYEEKINFIEPNNLWGIETEQFTTEEIAATSDDFLSEKVLSINESLKSNKLNEKLDESLNQQNVEVQNKCKEHTIKSICAIQHTANEDGLSSKEKINLVEPKNLWEMETELLVTEDLKQLKNNLEKSEISAISEDALSQHTDNEDGLSCEEKINFLEPKNLWEMETEQLTTEDLKQLKNNLEKSEIAAISDGALSQHTANEGGLSCEEKINLVEPKNLWETETEQLATEDLKQLKSNLEKSEIAAISEDALRQHTANEDDLSCEEKINLVEPKNLWEMETEPLATEDLKQSKNNSEKSEIAAISEDVLSEKVVFTHESLNQLEIMCEEPVEVICAIQHSTEEQGLDDEDKINFVEPKNLWEIETKEFSTEDHKQLKNNLKKSEIEVVQSKNMLLNREDTLSDVHYENKEKLQVLSERKEGKETELCSIEKRNHEQLDSTMEDEDFKGFDPIEYIADVKKYNQNTIICEPQKLDVESEMAKLFGTDNDNQIKNININGEEDCNILKKILEDTQEFGKMDCSDTQRLNTEYLQDERINSELSMDNSTRVLDKLSTNRENLKEPLSEMCTQPVMEPVSSSLNKSKMDSKLTISDTSQMLTQPVQIQPMDIGHKCIQELDVYPNKIVSQNCNDLKDLSNMSTQSILIGPARIDELEKCAIDDLKQNCVNDVNLSEMCTQAALNPTQGINVEQNKDSNTQSFNILNVTLSDMPTQPFIINPILNDERDKSTQDIDIDQNNESFSEISTQPFLINPIQIDAGKRVKQAIKFDQNKPQNSDNLKDITLSDMPTQAILLNPIEKDISENPTQAINVEQNKDSNTQSFDMNLTLSDMLTQPVLIIPTLNDEGEKSTQDIDQNNDDLKDLTLSEMCTQPFLINPNQIDVGERLTQAINVDQNEYKPQNFNNLKGITLSDTPTQSIRVNPTRKAKAKKCTKKIEGSNPENDVKDTSLSELCTQPVKTDKSENAGFVTSDNLSDVRTENIEINHHADSPSFPKSKPTISEDTIVYPSTKIRKSRINMYGKKTETNEKKFKPKLTLQTNKHSSTLPNDINRTSFFINQQKASNSLILESKNNSFDSSDDEDTHSNKRPRLFVISDDEDEAIAPNLTKSENAFEVDFNNKTTSPALFSKISSKNKIYNSTESVYSAVSMDETNVGVHSVLSDMEETLINVKCNQNRKFPMSPFLSKIVESESEVSPKTVSPKPKEFGRGKRVRVAKIFKEYIDTDEATEAQETASKKIKLGVKKNCTSDKKSNEKPEIIQQPSGSNEQVETSKPKRSRVAKNVRNIQQNLENANANVATELKINASTEHSLTILKNTRNRRTPIDKRGNNEQNISSKSSMSKNTRSSKNISPEENLSVENPDLRNGRKDCIENDKKTPYERSNSHKIKTNKPSISEPSLNSSSSTKQQENNEKNIPNPSKKTKNTRKSSEGNLPVEKPQLKKNRKNCTENDEKTSYEKSISRKRRTTKSSVSETSSNGSIYTSTSSNRVTRSRTKNEHGKLKILFNGNYDEDMPIIIDRLNGEIVENPYTCTVVVAEKVEPTVNFLCGLSQGRPIVSPSWLHCSRDAGYFIDPYKHILLDKEAEEKFSFCLKNCINKATQSPLLKGWSIFTNHTKPPHIEFKSIIECSGGIFLKKIPSRWTQNSLVISCPDDEIKRSTIEKRGKVTPKIVSSEAFITCVLRQTLDFNA